MERLDKIIANRGIASRREVKELVRQGRVLVDVSAGCEGVGRDGGYHGGRRTGQRRAVYVSAAA